MNQDLKSTLADTELTRNAAMLSWNEALKVKDTIVARTRLLESEWDKMVSEMQKLRHDRLAMEQLYSDVKKALVSEQFARKAERERMEAAFQRTLNEIKGLQTQNNLRKSKPFALGLKRRFTHTE